MTKDALVQRLMATFVGELEDHVRTLERDLLALEKDDRPEARGEIFNTLFRTSHSLKGAARSVQVDLVETASHLLEEIFAAAREERLPVNAEFFETLLPVVDALGDAGRRLRADGDLGRSRLDQLIAALSEFAPRKAEGGEKAKIAREPAVRIITQIAEPELPLEQAALPPPEQKPERKPEPQVEHISAPRPSGERWSNTVRVPADKLDALLKQSGELLTVRHRAEARSDELVLLHDMIAEARKGWRQVERGLKSFREADGDDELGAARAPAQNIDRLIERHRETLDRLERGLQRASSELTADSRILDLTAGPLDAEVRRTRMLPFSEACEGLDRMVRDIMANGEKKVQLVVEGGDIELDRSVLEGLRDPLLHLVRNAIDHGVETAQTRREKGKRESARIAVAAKVRGAQVEVTVADDGRGLDLVAIRDRLRARNLPVPQNDEDLIQQIFLHGMSTSASVTQLSGRGVGLDVVKTRLTAMRGTVDVSFEHDRGTQFTLRVPLTLTTLRAILVAAGQQVFAVDTSSVRRVFRVAVSDVKSIEGREVLLLDGLPVPLVGLADVVGAPRRAPSAHDKIQVVVLGHAARQIAVAIDGFLGEQEVTIRSLGARLGGVRGFGGATILPDGRIALILNPAALIDKALKKSRAVESFAPRLDAPKTVKKRLIVADDSITVRTLVKSILDAAGYDVAVAVDGAQAWQMLLEHGADLVVSDVEMPRMDGFALTEAIRGSKRFKNLPVILITARETDADKARGLAAGADAYQAKSAFDQKDLLATIEQIL